MAEITYDCDIMSIPEGDKYFKWKVTDDEVMGTTLGA